VGSDFIIDAEKEPSADVLTICARCPVLGDCLE
jgi:hypothetical protein